MKILKNIILFVIILTISVVFPTQNTLALNDFYSNNNILFYNSKSVDCYSGGAISLVGNDNLEKILRYYVGQGLTLIQASGIAGNYQQESHFNPYIIQGGAIADDNYILEKDVGFGIAQWTTESRQQNLEKFKTEENKFITDLLLQLDFSWKELTGVYSNALSKLKETTTPEDAAYIFHKFYEGSADSEEFVKEVRGGNAIIIYDSFKSIISDGSNIISTYSSGCSGDGTPSKYIGDFAIYNQYDPQWANEAYGTSTISASGCGPSAMAMAITALNRNIVTPSDTALFGTDNNLYIDGVGSSWTIVEEMSENWGLNSRIITATVTDINEALRDGGIVIVSGTGVSPFTSSGHYILIRAVTENGMWLIADSNGQKGINNSSIEYNPTTLINSGMNKSNVKVISV